VEGGIYLLCAATALVCSLLLFRGYRRTGTRLLLLCGLFFLSLTLENVLVFVDRILVPSVDLYLLRTSVALVGVGLFLVGLIWEVG
jgi:hypothetical protein